MDLLYFEELMKQINKDNKRCMLLTYEYLNSTFSHKADKIKDCNKKYLLQIYYLFQNNLYAHNYNVYENKLSQIPTNIKNLLKNR